MKKRIACLVTAMGLALGAMEAEAQVFTPTYMSPRLSGDVGVHLNDGPGSLSIEGIWRRSFGPYDLGFRAAVADRRDAVLLVGAEFRTPLELSDVPVQMAWTGGVQGAFGDGGAAGLQGGVTIGYALAEPGFTLVPYLHPRLALVSRFGRDDFDLDPLADIGFDLEIPQNLVFRLALGLGGPTASWGLGLAWR